MTALTKRQTKAREFLREIANANALGVEPTKWAIIHYLRSDVPSETRANHYRIIDRLIRLGLVENRGDGGGYALRITEAGHAELNAYIDEDPTFGGGE